MCTSRKGRCTMRNKYFPTPQILALLSIIVTHTTSFGMSQSQQHNAPASRLIDRPFLDAVAYVESHMAVLVEQIRGFSVLVSTIGEQWRRVAESQSPILLIIFIGFTILASIGAEFIVRHYCRRFHDKLPSYPVGELLPRITNTVFAICLEAVYAGCYIMVTFILYISILNTDGYAEIIASQYIIASYYIRLLIFLMIVLLSPSRPNLRIFPYRDEVARFMFHWMTLLCGIEIILVRSGIILKRLQAPENAFLALVAIVIVSTSFTLCLMIIKSRYWVAQTLSHQPSSGLPILSIQKNVAGFWHIPALLFICCITIIWELGVLGSNQILFGRVIAGLLTIPLFGAMDIWGQQLIAALWRKAGGRETVLHSQAESADTNENRKRLALTVYLQYVQLAYRVLLLILLFFMLLGLWNLDIPYGRMFTGSMLGLVAIVVISYMIWQLFTDWVDRKIKEEMPEEEDEADEGGKGGSRTGTLLLLLRKFVFVILVVLAIMFMLSAFGINIGPLIAGAGILGLAISFGAQSLVTDIFSGIFFLIDDAFRVGDYIDIGTAKGTVEHISLRSVRLRHHLGMVQTIPFGKIDTVTNYSRDFIITKLEIRVRYDTDIDKVRKIIKKIYQQLLVDEEFGPKLIGKVKSQGVKHMDDSAMIMRIKFTTPPGEQFVMRREIFRRIQEAFAQNNIEFAHRNVTVYMPPESETSKDSDSLRAVAGSAAGSAVLDEEKSTAQGAAASSER